MSRPSLQCVVLDCDGVILDSVEVKTQAFAACVAEHGPEAQRLLVEYHLAHGGVSRYEKFRHFHREFFGREISEAELAVCCQHFAQGCEEGVRTAPLVPGALEFLQAWHQRLPLYVASGTPQEELRQVLAQRGLSHYFQGIYGSPTPKAEVLAHIVQEGGYAPQATLMVGDASTDLAAAQAVGTLFYGRGPFAGHPWGPDLTELSAFVEELCRGS